MIPTFDQLLRPLPAMAAEEKITRRSATEAMVAAFKLTPAVATQRIPSGATTLIGNRPALPAARRLYLLRHRVGRATSPSAAWRIVREPVS